MKIMIQNFREFFFYPTFCLFEKFRESYRSTVDKDKLNLNIRSIKIKVKYRKINSIKNFLLK